MAKGDGFNNIFNNVLSKVMSSGVLDYFFGSRNNNHYPGDGYGGGYRSYGVPPYQLPQDNTTKYILWSVLGVAFIFVFYMMFNNKKR
ncbi:hypothetical protein CAPN001_08600 [Capnocytophaga stomatis]|uniref:hypothetical protein n=1 Tax=Capnocytophaga stomatis TaxID=1848904 RepID=UPI001951FB9C|nr:hypothetical protein [Capnocytophaga stomatis]GIJ93001.1 hypothetical protein CAPN002_02190 [Capnocytophaga stomatis]GIJ96291.1 hypothetical protein CAPN001_08600 [Capnocytophaga stomatis]